MEGIAALLVDRVEAIVEPGERLVIKRLTSTRDTKEALDETLKFIPVTGHIPIHHE